MLSQGVFIQTIFDLLDTSSIVTTKKRAVSGSYYNEQYGSDALLSFLNLVSEQPTTIEDLASSDYAREGCISAGDADGYYVVFNIMAERKEYPWEWDVSEHEGIEAPNFSITLTPGFYNSSGNFIPYWSEGDNKPLTRLWYNIEAISGLVLNIRYFCVDEHLLLKAGLEGKTEILEYSSIPLIIAEGSLPQLTTADDIAAIQQSIVEGHQFLKDCISAALINGKISVNKIFNAASSVRSNAIVEQALSLINSVDDLDATSIVSFISNVWKANSPTSTTTTKYDPIPTPNYVTDFITEFLSVIVMAVTVILSIIFKAIGIVISLLITLVSELVTIAREHLTNTVISVNRLSALNAFSYPLLTLEFKDYPYDISLLSAAYSKISEDVLDCGVLAVTHYNANKYVFTSEAKNSTPAYFLFAPVLEYESGENITADSHPRFNATTPSGFCQLLLPCGILTDSKLDLSQNYKTDGDGYTYSVNLTVQGSDTYPTSLNQVHYKSDISDWMSLSEKDQIYHALYGLMFLIDSLKYNVESITTPTDYNVTIKVDLSLLDGSSIEDIFKKLRDTEWTAYSFNIKLGMLKCLLSFLLDLLDGKIIGAGGTTVEYANYVVPTNWSEFVPIFQQIAICLRSAFAHSQQAFSFTLESLGGADSDLPDWAIPGHDLLDPNVDLPTASRSALIKTAFTIVIGAIAVTTCAKLFSNWRKRRAVKRLYVREQQFELAKEAYSKDPSSSNLRQLTRANRRLGRAYNRASYAGLSSWNGKSTGSLSSPTFNPDISSLGSDIFSQFTTDPDVVAAASNTTVTTDLKPVISLLT